jgi:ankyrin repeat protein
MVSLLIDAGAIVDLQDNNGNTPLGTATFESRGRGEMISILLRAGADRNCPNAHGQTPLKLAKLIANYDVAKFFE